LALPSLIVIQLSFNCYWSLFTAEAQRTQRGLLFCFSLIPLKKAGLAGQRKTKRDSHQKLNINGLVKSQESSVFVIPADAGIHENQDLMDLHFREGDGLGNFLRSPQYQYKQPS
jgi:hypothetical protein